VCAPASHISIVLQLEFSKTLTQKLNDFMYFSMFSVYKKMGYENHNQLFLLTFVQDRD